MLQHTSEWEEEDVRLLGPHDDDDDWDDDEDWDDDDEGGMMTTIGTMTTTIGTTTISTMTTNR
ncbi:MAG: hypothetical protein R2856_02905 [Caldilineaceae bacterium]